MDKRNFVNQSFIRHSIATRKRYGAKGSFAIDQTPSLPFNIDPDTGRPMSDIQKLVKIQDAVNQQALFSQLKEFKGKYLPADMTDEDALVFIKSRHCQTKSELLDYKTGLAKYQLEQQQKLASVKAKEEEKRLFDERQKKIDEMWLDFENSKR